jgi:hypothetical protein
MSDDILRAQALALVASADAHSVLLVLRQFSSLLRQHGLPAPDVVSEFVRERGLALQRSLEAVESRDPGLAARLSAVIERECTIAPPAIE